MASSDSIKFKPFCAALGISPSTGWRWVKHGRLKEPIKVSDKIRSFTVDYLDEVVAELAAGSAAGE